MIEEWLKGLTPEARAQVIAEADELARKIVKAFAPIMEAAEIGFQHLTNVLHQEVSDPYPGHVYGVRMYHHALSTSDLIEVYKNEPVNQ